jgi:hypothetical protein
MGIKTGPEVLCFSVCFKQGTMKNKNKLTKNVIYRRAIPTAIKTAVLKKILLRSASG